jgi:cytochrome P450
MLGNYKVYSSRVAHLLPVTVDDSLLEGDLSQTDPPKHRKLRNLLSPYFTAELVAAMEPRILAITTELLDAVDGKPEIELLADLAHPLPVIVICELLGIPASDRVMFRGWADGIIESFSGFSFLDKEEGQKDVTEGTERLQPMLHYLREHIAECRRSPREGLLTHLATAEVDGERLTDNEAVMIASIMLITGHITTSMVLGNTVLCLDAYPAEAARIRADRSMVPGAIDEALRLLSPATLLPRSTAMEAEIAGCHIPKDQFLFLWLGAANRDPRQFDRPSEFLPTRDPNPHFGFGRGIHYCLGAGLARLEARIALNELFDRFPVLSTDPADPPELFKTKDMLGVARLHLYAE